MTGRSLSRARPRSNVCGLQSTESWIKSPCKLGARWFLSGGSGTDSSIVSPSCEERSASESRVLTRLSERVLFPLRMAAASRSGHAVRLTKRVSPTSSPSFGEAIWGVSCLVAGGRERVRSVWERRETSGVVSLNNWSFAATFLPVADMLEGTWSGVDVKVEEETEEFDEWEGLSSGRGGDCGFRAGRWRVWWDGRGWGRW